MAKTPPSNAGGTVSIPGWELRSYMHAPACPPPPTVSGEWGVVTSPGDGLREAEVSDRLEEHLANRIGQEVPWDDGRQ